LFMPHSPICITFASYYKNDLINQFVTNKVVHFERADIQTVMSMPTRWYDVEVEHEGVMPDQSGAL
jgi:hypothetical protein